jgi:hypothetical protein
MISYTSKVNADFIARRDYLANNRYNSPQRGNRTLNQVMVNCDCEYAEHHISTLDLGHILQPHIEYDTNHAEHGRCEFKHVPKSGMVYISKWCQAQDFDTFVFWRFVQRDWSRPLIDGDMVTYKILEYKSKEEVVANIKNEVYYEHIHSK